MARNETAGSGSRFAGLESIPLEVTVKVGSARCRLVRLEKLKPGDTIQLERRIGEPFDLCSGSILLARVEPVAHAQGIAVKLVEIPEEEDDPGA